MRTSLKCPARLNVKSTFKAVFVWHIFQRKLHIVLVSLVLLVLFCVFAAFNSYVCRIYDPLVRLLQVELNAHLYMELESLRAGFLQG